MLLPLRLKPLPPPPLRLLPSNFGKVIQGEFETCPFCRDGSFLLDCTSHNVDFSSDCGFLRLKNLYSSYEYH